MKEWLIAKDDIIDKEPGEGDMVLYFVFNPRTRRYHTKAGIIARELCDIEWVICGEVRQKEQVLFVLKHDAYMIQKRFNNPLAF